MLQNNLIPNISLSVIASVLSSVQSDLACLYLVLDNFQDFIYQFRESNNYLGIIQMNLIIWGLLR